MSGVHFGSLDLNLLRVFKALFAERSATRAGEALGLSQSAISHALGRLRRHLGDELFMRSPEGLVPTSRAAAIGPQIIDTLKQLESVIAPAAFEPGASDRRFVIGATAYFCAVLLPSVMQRFGAAAPHARLRIRGDNLHAEELDRGRLDVIIGAFEAVPPRFVFAPLFEEAGVWVVRARHPALEKKGQTMAALEGLRRLAIAPDDGPALGLHGRSDAGLRRPVAWRYELEGHEPDGESVLSVPDTYSALAMVRQTDMTAMLPRRLAEPAAALGGLALIEPERRQAPLVVGAVTRAGEAGGITWLVDIMRDAASALPPLPGAEAD